MSIDSDQINFLIYRYLIESGFQHSSFTFAQESGVTRSSVTSNKIPPGALIAHLQRALNYVQAEVNLTEDGRPADLEDLDAVEALNLIEACQPEVCEQRRKQLTAHLKEQGKLNNYKPQAPEPAPTSDTAVSQADTILFRGHEKVVFTCAWNPQELLLASGSSDSTARIWDVKNPTREPAVLRHVTGNDGARDVTSLHWSPDGLLLASGSYDGVARIWSKTGDLQLRLTGHNGPIFSLRWSPSGKLLVTSGVDGSAIVWQTANGEQLYAFHVHSDPCVDAAWRDEDVLACCSTDKTVSICNVKQRKLLHRLTGHEDEVNSVRWHDSGMYLASCSDDKTARIWDLDKAQCMHVLRHDDKLYAISWCAAQKTSARMLIATASFDKTARIWEARSGNCLFTLAGHSMPVYSVHFSHDGAYLATGSFDHAVMVWSVENGQMVRRYNGQGGVFEVAWSRDDKHIAACSADSMVAVIKFQDA
eukprot:TRINITY_DN12503_c1_g4_i2.p1 TRINITY_DN12503_c1_g4~~TRINITY_DN12503_c1_g4_i2.p1  ORF type:complete len:476 (+),score=55.15 TRINITY_DN12503_c1_g4_i2:101-1528(+)